jgi:hypothetical protein
MADGGWRMADDEWRKESRPAMRKPHHPLPITHHASSRISIILNNITRWSDQTNGCRLHPVSPRETSQTAGSAGRPTGSAQRAALDVDQAAVERGGITWQLAWIGAAVYCATIAEILAVLLIDYAAGR